MNETTNFLSSLVALRDSTKYVLDFLNNEQFATNNNSNTSNNDNEINCSQAFDVLNTLKRDVQTFTNTNFIAPENDDSSEEFKECETNLDNLHSQLTMIVDSFNSDLDILNSTEDSSNDVNNTNNNANEPKLNIVLSHQETLKSIDAIHNSEIYNTAPQLNITNSNQEKENNKQLKNSKEEVNNQEEKPKNTEKINKPLYCVTAKNNEATTSNQMDSNNIKKKSNVAKNFLFTNTMPQTPEIEKIKNYITDVDLNQLNNIEIIKLILDSLIQNCNEILQLKSDTLSDVLGAYPKSPITSNIISIDYPNDDNMAEASSPNADNNEKLKTIQGSNEKDKNVANNKIDTNNDTTNNNNKQKTPKELLKELECLIILIHSLYESIPNSVSNENNKAKEESLDINSISRNDSKDKNDSMSCVLTSNAELNSVINAIDSLLKSSPRFNNQCVQFNSESKKKFQLMGVLSVVDRMTRTRLNDQRATPNQLDRVNRLIDLLNNSLVRQYVEQRFTITPDREKRMELGRISHLLEKSKNSRLTNQDWVSKKLIREKEIEDIFEQSKYQTLENQRFVMAPSKERDMYFNSLLNRVGKLDSYRLSNQDAVIKRTKTVDDSLCSFTDSDAEIASKTKEGPIKRIRRFSKSIKS